MENSIRGGKTYSIVYQAVDLAAAASVNLGITTPATGFIYLDSIVLSTSANTTRVSVYENISYTEGSARTPLNLNRNSGATTDVTAKTGVTATVSGVPMDVIIGTVYSGTVSGSVQSVLDQGQEYVFEISNIGASTATTATLIVTFTESIG